MYYWCMKVKDGPWSAIGRFTRILHSGLPDHLMEEIPTFVVDPLAAGLDKVSSLMLPCHSLVTCFGTFSGCLGFILYTPCILDLNNYNNIRANAIALCEKKSLRLVLGQIQ